MKTMNKTRRLFCISIFSLIINGLCYAEQTNASTAAVELGKILQSTSTLKADFIQVIYDQKQHMIRKISGNMVIKKPGLFRWQITAPEPSLIVIDGKKFWNYDEELQQVTVQKVDKNYENSPVGLLLAAEIKDITKHYNVNKLHDDCFELVPINEVDSFKKVQLSFKNGIIKKLELFDQLEQLSKINFSNVQSNVNVDQKLFNFVPPAGVDVVGAKE